MNPLVRNHLDQLAASVRQVAELVASEHAQLQDHAAEKERATRETWNKDRKVAILEENVTRLNEVLEENRRLREKHSQAMEHAAKLLAHVRELQAKFTP
jgi:predicted nuclease with TOPRIM domain